jgi:hypothetical protein
MGDDLGELVVGEQCCGVPVAGDLVSGKRMMNDEFLMTNDEYPSPFCHAEERSISL